MLPKKRRVRTKEVKEIFTGGKILLRTSLLTLRFLKKEESVSQFAVIVSKTILKKSNERIRVRRRWYAVLRSIPVSTIVPGLYVVILSSMGTQARGKEIQKALSPLYEKNRH